MAGLSAAGFETKSLDELKTAMESLLKDRYGESFDVSADSIAGNLIGVCATLLSECWELGLADWFAMYPNSAVGVSLDEIGTLTGVTRLPETYSTATITATGDAGTVIEAGKLFSVSTTGAQFQTLVSFEIGGGGTVAMTVQAVEPGPVIAAAGTLTVIDTPVSGLDSVTNAADAILGRDEETDAAFRIRRSQLLQATGTATINAIRSDVLNVDGIKQVVVFENTTDAVVDGIAAHGIMVVALGVTVDNDQAVVNAIGSSKGAGIATSGGESGTYVDDQGFAHTINYELPTDIPIYIEIDITTDPDTFPVDGVAQIKQAIVDYGDAFLFGQDVIFSKFYGPIYGISGVENVTALLVDDIDPPVGNTDIVIAQKEIATFDTSNITVNVT